MRIFRFAVLLLAFFVLEAAFGQTTGTKAKISGIVLDPAGAVVPGASVSLTSPDGKRPASTRSGDTGRFQFSVAKPGEYTVEVKHPGFKVFTAIVQVSGASVKPIQAVLEIADVAERMDVTVNSDAAQVSTDPAENRDAAVVSGDSMERLPIFDQDYVGALSSFLDQGSIGTSGTTIVVDGMEQKDAGVTPSAIQSVKINNDPYSAEYSRPGRGRIEITTKSASSAYHGTVNFIFRDYHLNARNPFATTTPPEQRRIFEGVLTGPVGRSKKTSFLLSADYQQDNVQSIVYAQVRSGLLQENVPSPIRAKDVAARVAHDFNDNHTVTLQFTYEGNLNRNQLTAPGQNLATAQKPTGHGSSGALGGDVLPEAASDAFSLERHLTFSDKLVITPSLLNQMQVMYERNRDSTTSATDAARVIVQGAFTGGGAQSTQFSTENNLDFRDVLSWSHGKHTVMTGLMIPNMSRRGLDNYSDRGGTFNFASLQDYMLGNPYSFTQQQGPVHFVYWQREVGAFVQDQVRLGPNLQVAFGVRWDWQNYLHDENNFAPRASLGYAFGKDRKTVLRVGSGVFYDRTGGRPLANLAQYSGPAIDSVLLLNPAYPNPFAGGLPLSAQPPTVYRLSPNIRTPYSILYSAGIERQVFGSATIAATYRGSVGVSLFTSLDVNQPLPPRYLARPDASYGLYQEVQSSGRQVSNSLDLSFSGKLGRYMSGLAQYTFSRTNNNTSGMNYMPPNTYDLSGEYSRADFDQRHRFSMLVDSNPSKWLDLGIGFTAATGLPYSLTLGQDIFNTGYTNARPAGVPRNSLEGPGFAEVDLRWSHDFALSHKGDKGPVATFAADAFNLTNRVNYTQHIGNEQSPFFGQSISALPPRRLQFTLRLKF